MKPLHHLQDKQEIKGPKGFVLLLSVLTASILLVIALGMLSIVEKGLLLSSIGEDSQLALYAADAGSECALYWDFKYVDTVETNNSSAFATSSESQTTPGAGEGIECNGRDIKSASSPSMGGANHTLVAALNDGSATTTFELVLANNTCATVVVMKSLEGRRTIVESRGYNTCDLSFPRRLERILQYFY